MKRAKISNNVIRRLPRYLRTLDDLVSNGVGRISSGELGRRMGLTPSQIRQDFSCFGEFGQQGYGYNVDVLSEEMSAILGMKRGFSLIIVGVGNLGHALIKNFSFGKYGFKLIGAFDTDPAVVGAELMGVRILHAGEMPAFLAANKVDVAVLCVPGSEANAAAGLLAGNGVQAIWNFTNIELNVSERGVLVEDIHFSDSLLALSYHLAAAAEESV